ncbi:hypothetical protein FJTKL_10661 [Diaporthe vaccinii]|uniref:CHCH domain-containing protein n=1 Tax=Diaporthe vaccinii TaxID=105482 RepID=A0ABR4FB85_9PEZI
MTPPCPNFHPSQLPQQIQFSIDGKKRKTEGGKDIDLKACELLGLLQYDCSVEHPQRQDSSVKCYPVQRWFRRCQDKKGSFTVETTAWEGTTAAIAPSTASASALGSSTQSTPEAQSTTTHWHDGNKTDYFQR